MTEALNRVIAEQQTRIDQLLEGNKKLIERSARVFKQNEELFEAWAKLWDADWPTNKDNQEATSEYVRLKLDVRRKMQEVGYCMTCYNFICECEDQYD